MVKGGCENVRGSGLGKANSLHKRAKEFIDDKYTDELK